MDSECEGNQGEMKVKNKILKGSAAITRALLLVPATFGGGGVYAQDGGSGSPGTMSGPMSMTGACTTGLAASMLTQAQMMVTPVATTDGAAATTEATAEATMDMAGTPMATTEGGATAEATAEATMDMAGT